MIPMPSALAGQVFAQRHPFCARVKTGELLVAWGLVVALQRDQIIGQFALNIP
jgi:hypothetical protein